MKRDRVTSIPHSKKRNGKTLLMVHDKPFTMLAGELHNSNSSTTEAIDAFCKKAVKLGMNSVIATLSWEMIEPVGGSLIFPLSMSSGNRAHGTYNSNYQVGANEALDAGTSPTSGGDKGNYATRIGLAFYGCDIHPYQPSDYVNSNGDYICGNDSYKQMWPAAKNPDNPLYMPYEALRTGYVANLLIPGYGANVCSYSWGEVRYFLISAF